MLCFTKTNKSHHWIESTASSSVARLAISVCLVFVSAGVAAQSVTVPGSRVSSQPLPGQVTKQSIGLQHGLASKYNKTTLTYETPSLWSHPLSNGWGTLDLDLELGLAYWKAKRDTPKSLWQVSAIPFLRWWPQESLYLEVGVGPTLLSRTQFAGRELSTRFQFGSHVGAGVLLHDTHRIGLRYSHYSNANIKKPNQGLGALQLTYSYMF